MRQKFLEYIKNNVVLFDGAMGTEIYARGKFINICYDELNLTQPQVIKEIHQSYIDAGTDVIETNTFAANRVRLKKYGLEDKLYDINYVGAKNAREIAGDDIYVAGSIGPPGVFLAPRGTLKEQEAEELFSEQTKALIDGGIDLILLESFTDLQLIGKAIQSIKKHFDIPIVAQMTIGVDGHTSYGTAPDRIAQKLENWGADVVGVNCTVGPKVMLEAVEKMVPATNCPVSVMPNAGLPQNIDGRHIYLATADYFGEYTKHFINAGVRAVGGCCGTNADFTKAMRKTIQSLQPRKQIEKHIHLQIDEEKHQIPQAEKSEFARKMFNKEFVTTVEIVPPRGSDAKKALEQSRVLKEAGVDAVNIPDGPRALSRMGAQYLSLMIQQETGMEVIQHNACRDRNLLGMVGDLIGADAIGIRNLLIITGDPPKMGSFPDATAVFDVDAIGLTSVVTTLNQGFDMGGNPMPKPMSFFIGVGVNPGAIDLDKEIGRLEEKIEAGAEYAITQPVFDIDIFRKFQERISHLSLPIIAGIWPLVSIRNAEFMNNEVPGASVPDAVMKRIYASKSKEEARTVGIDIARETIQELKSSIAGVQVSMPFGNVQYPLKVLKGVI